MVKKILKSLSLNPKLIFMIDGLGAALTAILLVTIVRNFESFFGMPRGIVNGLAILALIMSIYSLLSFQFLGSHIQKFLIVIILANLFYCVLTISLIIYCNLPLLGIIYFTVEILIVIGLVYLELKMLEQVRKTS